VLRQLVNNSFHSAGQPWVKPGHDDK